MGKKQGVRPLIVILMVFMFTTAAPPSQALTEHSPSNRNEAVLVNSIIVKYKPGVKPLTKKAKHHDNKANHRSIRPRSGQTGAPSRRPCIPFAARLALVRGGGMAQVAAD
jgi:hypothetical protein